MEVNFSFADIEQVAAKLLGDCKGFTVFALQGEMGAGKTTLVHALCKVMGVTDNVSSPTFSIINQYSTADGETVFHMDLYRIKDENEAINAGVEDSLYSGNTCFVEWPERAPGIFPDHTVYISISSVNDNTRILKYNL